MNICVIGTGGHSRVIIDSIRLNGGEVFWNGVANSISDIPSFTKPYVVAIGDNYGRRKLVEKMSDLPYYTVIHPTAIISDNVQIGQGTVIMAGAIINSGCKIGRHCIINTGAILEHDSIMEDFSSLGPRVVTGGGVCIKRGTAIGIGATISNNVTIWHNTVIGAGAVVVDKEIPFGVVAYGVPCKVVRNRSEAEPYLT